MNSTKLIMILILFGNCGNPTFTRKANDNFYKEPSLNNTITEEAHNNSDTNNLSITAILNTHPELEIIEPSDKSVFTKGTEVNFKFSLFDGEIDMCKTTNNENVLKMYNSILQVESDIILDSNCSALIRLPDVISTFPLTFTYSDLTGLYDYAVINIITVNNQYIPP